MLTTEWIALPPLGSLPSKFVNIEPIFNPHNQGFFKASFDSSAETMVSDKYFHIFMMKQMQFIDEYWRIHVLVSCAQCPDCIQTCLTYMQIMATSYMGMSNASITPQVEKTRMY